MSKKMPWFPFYASDFVTDTAEMTDEEVGVYIRMLAHQWINGSLTADINRVAIAISPGAPKCWDQLSHKFEIGQDGRMRNPRLEKERKNQTGYQTKQSHSGSKGATSRWEKEGADAAAAMVDILVKLWPDRWQPYHSSDGERIGEVMTRAYESLTVIHNTSFFTLLFKQSLDFSYFWEVYGKKLDKKKTEHKWDKLMSRKVKEQVLHHIHPYIKATNTDGTFPSRKNPYTYLNSEAWKDEQLPGDRKKSHEPDGKETHESSL